MKRLKRLSTIQNTTTMMVLIGLLTAISSEVKIMPFDEAPFRFGLGSIVFFLAILIKPVPVFKTGLITALIVWLFRTALMFLLDDSAEASIYLHIPAALFYIAFAIGLQCLDLQTLKMRPIVLGLYGALFEIIGNVIEQLVIAVSFRSQWLSGQEFLLLGVVAILRSFFVIGLFSTLTMAEQKKRTEQLLAIGSDLYVETLYIQKSMDTIERITADGFALYQQLKPVDPRLSLKALMLAQEIHEVKKDSERIYAGLSKIVATKSETPYAISDLLNMIVEGNVKYAHSTGKDIDFRIELQGQFDVKEPLLLLAMLNNIVANAIEAIDSIGWVRLHVSRLGDSLCFIIENNGPSIPEEELPILFDAGFTTKFNDSGFASTGIGLSHVYAIVQRLEGTIEVQSSNTTFFQLTIPLYKLL